MQLTQDTVAGFQTMIFSWWDDHRRDLPWRHTHDPYAILVSEVMLQQTQVSRVLSKYSDFIAAYPTVFCLAASSVSDVLKMWQGMGYNRRALYLQRTAQKIVGEYNGRFPKSEKDLLNLPGLGKYTARAILVFAYRQNIAMVDTNIRQIILHYFFDDIPQKESVIQDTADLLLPKGKAWEWHQALMDFGALALERKLVRKGVTKQFHDTDRYVRGRIVDLLRQSTLRKKELYRQIMEITGRKENDLDRILHNLLKDSLITYNNDIYSLPE